jgi:hypothetical protein
VTRKAFGDKELGGCTQAAPPGWIALSVSEWSVIPTKPLVFDAVQNRAASGSEHSTQRLE